MRRAAASWRQAELPGARVLLCCTPVDRSGAHAYVALIKGPSDPERSGRPRGGRADRAPHRTNAATPAAEWAERIAAHMADGEARTFNRICVELLDQEASICHGGPVEEGLWALVGAGRLAHTMDAPVLFRAARGDCG